ncbi:exosortase system-associated protein, TIGR04073 family [Geobacter sp. FeAm09]|uniref:exosortase system-associated protein, TIGR04073 family n=1 Tax=Geobacter sp. FeAm09 TaxID=2597769 RepID=UPI0011ECA521|nr:exosortase system-associated protein, TIGR04073 family [Geobacter sp. FeAm09]QEM69956.1 exosortase system-associated protein, TIGR04073 family [Geobacter sp. FeAm09]
MGQLRSLVATALLLAASLCVQPAQATDQFKTVETSTPQEVVGGMSVKMVRGVANATLGWWELPKQVYQTFHEEGVGMGLTVGPLKGLGMTLVRTLSGVGEVLTFPFPYPGFYAPYFEPEFVWQKERK